MIYRINKNKVYFICGDGHAYSKAIEEIGNTTLLGDGLTAPQCPYCDVIAVEICVGDRAKGESNENKHVLNQTYAKLLYDNGKLELKDKKDKEKFSLGLNIPDEGIEIEVHPDINSRLVGNGYRLIDGEFIKGSEVEFA